MQTLIARYRQAFDIAPSVRRATDMPGRSQVENARFLALYQMAIGRRGAGDGRRQAAL